MNLQINLLKKSERRYQGIVSMKVMALSSIGVLAGVTILVLSLAGISKVTLNANLDRAQRELERLDPQANLVRKAQAAVVTNQKTLAELEGRASGKTRALFSILRAVQSQIPAQMVLESLYAGTEQAYDAAAGSFFTLRLTGLAQGELTAVDAKRQLNATAEVREFCGEVKLVSSQRKEGETWLFALEGRRPAGGNGK